MQTIGIIGIGLAGLRAAAELRARGFTGTIVGWNAEGVPPYDRPPLSKELFGDFHHLLADDGLGDLDELAVDVCGEARTITRDGTWFVDGTPVDVLIIASGARPVQSIAGASTLYTLQDARALRASITPGSTVHVVGAGWIGMEVASVASAIGASVNVWEASQHFLDRTFHGTVDDIWGTWCEEAGVNVHLNQPYPGGNCDVLVQATGARPTVDFLPVGARTARGALQATSEGCVLDEEGTEIPSLYAAGDCADLGGLPGGHWTQALSDAGRLAACIMGESEPRPAPPEVFSTQFGHEITLIGEVPQADTGVREGLSIRWESGAFLGIDAPRETSRARKALRKQMAAAQTTAAIHAS
ncbi:FAD-dependent oxidoreductase [Ancrocorticia sp.]|uniref:FAD-dependent oxidoreductase n=1 Tax=Ancrocorticia sp. TaxID=2593684 RepID=UPI003F924084